MKNKKHLYRLENYYFIPVKLKMPLQRSGINIKIVFNDNYSAITSKATSVLFPLPKSIDAL